jgi:hypothetical protein
MRRSMRVIGASFLLMCILALGIGAEPGRHFSS